MGIGLGLGLGIGLGLGLGIGLGLGLARHLPLTLTLSTFVSQADTRRLDSQPIVRASSHLVPLVGDLGYFEVCGLHGSSVGLVRGPRYDPKLHTGHIGWRRTAYPEPYALPYPHRWWISFSVRRL